MIIEETDIPNASTSLLNDVGCTYRKQTTCQRRVVDHVYSICTRIRLIYTSVDFTAQLAMPLDIPSVGLNPSENTCSIEATVVSGFENLAKEECRRKLGRPSGTSRGRIFFDLPMERLPKVMELRSVDNVFLVIYNNPQFVFSVDKESCLKSLRPIVSDCLWEKGLDAWQTITGFSKSALGDMLHPSVERVEGQNELIAKDSVKFRVTCKRSGKSHSFGSPDAAISFGGAINDKFGWKAEMVDFDLEVVLNIVQSQVYVCISLTKESLHHRNITNFGYTTLRSTIAYNLLLMANIKEGDVVCDPMCGSGAIPIEAAVCWNRAYHLCGDNHPAAMERTLKNVKGVNESGDENVKQLSLDVVNWDSTLIPLRNNSVDVFVTDLPFGKRSGSRTDNRTLYPKVLSELGRASAANSGRAVLLTHDRRNMLKALQKVSHIWKCSQQLTVNIGGLAAGVYYVQKRPSESGSFEFLATQSP